VYLKGGEPKIEPDKKPKEEYTHFVCEKIN
jgi:hypothetical protein